MYTVHTAHEWPTHVEDHQGHRAARGHPRVTPSRVPPRMRRRVPAPHAWQLARRTRTPPAQGRADHDRVHKDHAAGSAAAIASLRQRRGGKQRFASLPPGELNFGAKNTTKSPWWPQRDSNPCFSHDHVFASILAWFSTTDHVET